jgi:hypothetical protein
MVPMQITEGEENLQEGEHGYETSTNQAKKLHTRISETAASIEQHRQRMQRAEAIRANRQMNMVMSAKSASPRPEKFRSPDRVQNLKQPQKYGMNSQKWDNYMAAEVYRMKMQLADKNVSPLKRAANQQKTSTLMRATSPFATLNSKSASRKVPQETRPAHMAKDHVRVAYIPLTDLKKGKDLMGRRE